MLLSTGGGGRLLGWKVQRSGNCPWLWAQQGCTWAPPHLLPSSAGPAPRCQGQVCLASLAGHRRGQLDGLCALLVLFGALPWSRLPGGDRKSAWTQGPDPCGDLRDLMGGGLGIGGVEGWGDQGEEAGKL